MHQYKPKIHPPYNLLKVYAKDNGIKYSDMAKVIGVTETTISMKINGDSDFYLNEFNALKKAFGIPDYFFCY